ncbi:MAG: cation:proton antiporter [Bacteroidales bacterium]|jgi:CPA2 family monovalent cation:H+ antiporter-2|nr:cation:proton antiporter [Bacteroidales bacterium]
MEEIHFVSDVALMLIVAGIITLIFKWLKQPLVLGYIVAGFIVSPNFVFFPTVTDTHTIEQWSEIGIVFLLFALGLEFSIKKLLHVGSAAFITAGSVLIFMFLTGFGVGHLLGWTTMECIFLGGMLSMSSTTIIVKAFSDLGLKSQKFTGIVLGTLIVEDIMAVLMMVLLSTAAVSQQFSGTEMLFSIGKLLFFIILCFAIGISVLPSFFRKVRKWINDETLLILSIGLCFGMVTLATKAGFSSAFGAFVMGSILAGTIESEHIEKLIKSIKDLFGAIFFVSVGMLVNPQILAQYWAPVLILSVVILIGQPLFASFGALLSGQSLQTSIRTGFSLAQIGEFAFIIATLGISLNVLSPFVYPIIVAVSVVTTFTTPYFIRLADPFYGFLDKHLPEKFKTRIDRHTSGTRTVNHQSDWQRLIKAYLPRVLILTVFLIAIILAYRQWFFPFMQEHFGQHFWVKIVCAVIAIAVMSPFLRGLLLNKGTAISLFSRLWVDQKYSRGGLLTLVLARVFIAVAAVVILLLQTFHFAFFVIVVIALAIAGFILLSKASLTRYSQMESRFMANLNQKDKKHPIRSSIASRLADKDIHLMTVVVSPDSASVGKTIRELPVYTNTGVVIVKIERGNREIYLPKASEPIYPYDTLLVLGTNEQLHKYTAEVEHTTNETPVHQDIELQTFVIEENTCLCGKSLETIQLREKYACWIVGIERSNEQIMNPKGDTILEVGDLVWIVGEKNDIVKLIKDCNNNNYG